MAAVASSASPSVEVGRNSFPHSCCCVRLGSCDLYSGVHTGGKHFSRDLQPLNADGEVLGMWGVCVSLFLLPNRPASDTHTILSRPPIIHIHHTSPNTSYHAPLPHLSLPKLHQLTHPSHRNPNPSPQKKTTTTKKNHRKKNPQTTTASPSPN